ncbi:signal recognition particle [Solibacillus sp. FSL W7-1464]|uniref:signal recognition particle n=1 Tax=Solibacillus sp. FSL W7-1464 TaxID=2921706 RepID=UPI0030FB95AE
MFEEEKLRELKKIQVDPEKRAEDFKKIQQRLDSKPFHWQIPAVMIAIACITLFLVGTFPQKQQTTSDDPDSSALQAVYYMDWEGDPKSTLQAGVKKVKNEETLKAVETLLEQLQKTDIIMEEPYIDKSYRLQFEDNTVMRLQEFHGSEATYYRDIGTGQRYLLEDQTLRGMIELHEPADGNISSIINIVVFILLIFAMNRVSKKLRDPEDPKRHLPTHSTYWQSVVEILTFLILVLFVSVPQLHLFQLIAFLLLSALINILLEAKYGKKKWRMVQFIISKLYFLIIMYGLLWI